MLLKKERKEVKERSKVKGHRAVPDTFEVSIRTLRKGCTGRDVKSLQRLLFADGYSVGSCGDDGDFGKDTEKAVINFQSDHDLESDGIVGPKTFRALWGC